MAASSGFPVRIPSSSTRVPQPRPEKWCKIFKDTKGTLRAIFLREISMPSTVMPDNVASQARVFGEPQLHTDGDLFALSFAQDGSLWSVEEPGVLRQWNAANGQQLHWLSLSDLETAWTFSRDMRLLASASDDLTLWDISSGQ